MISGFNFSGEVRRSYEKLEEVRRRWKKLGEVMGSYGTFVYSLLMLIKCSSIVS